MPPLHDRLIRSLAIRRRSVVFFGSTEPKPLAGTVPHSLQHQFRQSYRYSAVPSLNNLKAKEFVPNTAPEDSATDTYHIVISRAFPA